MNEAFRIERAGEGEYTFSGALTFATAAAVWKEGAALFMGPGPLSLDMGGVTRADSAGLALLVEWTRTARARGITIVFKNVPAQMRSMAKLADLQGVLPIAVEETA